MKVWFLVLLAHFFMFFIAPDALACRSCNTRVTYNELCAQTMASAGYEGNFASLCFPIQSAPALECVEGLVSHDYDNISQDVMNGCSWANSCGMVALQALFDAGYDNVSGNLIAAIGHSHSHWQALCMASAFKQGYDNITANNVRQLCP